MPFERFFLLYAELFYSVAIKALSFDDLEELIDFIRNGKK